MQAITAWPGLGAAAGAAGQRSVAGAVGPGERRGPGGQRTCSTWPARGNARRRTRSGSAPASTSSPRWLDKPALPRPARPARAGGPAAGRLGQPRAAAVHDHPGNAMHGQGATPTVSGTRPSALVYADVDMNLLDGSAIWLQSMTQALVAAGCAVTLVLKAPGPHRPAHRAAARRRGGHHPQPARRTAPAGTHRRQPDRRPGRRRARRRRRRPPPRPGGAPRPGAGLRRRPRRRLRRAAVVLPDRRPAGHPRGDPEGRRGPHRDREGLPLPALPDRGAALLPRRQRRGRLR